MQSSSTGVSGALSAHSSHSHTSTTYQYHHSAAASPHAIRSSGPAYAAGLRTAESPTYILQPTPGKSQYESSRAQQISYNKAKRQFKDATSPHAVIHDGSPVPSPQKNRRATKATSTRQSQLGLQSPMHSQSHHHAPPNSNGATVPSASSSTASSHSSRHSSHAPAKKKLYFDATHRPSFSPQKRKMLKKNSMPMIISNPDQMQQANPKNAEVASISVYPSPFSSSKGSLGWSAQTSTSVESSAYSPPDFASWRAQLRTFIEMANKGHYIQSEEQSTMTQLSEDLIAQCMNIAARMNGNEEVRTAAPLQEGTTADQKGSTALSHSPLVVSLAPEAIDLNMQTPLPSNPFYPSHHASTMPAMDWKQVEEAKEQQLALRDKERKTIAFRQSFHLSTADPLSEALIEWNEAHEMPNESVEASSSRARQARVTSLPPERGPTMLHIVRMEIQGASEASEALLAEAKVEHSQAQAPVPSFPFAAKESPSARSAYSEKVSHGDFVTGGALIYDWDLNDFSNMKSELRSETRAEIQLTKAEGFEADNLVRIDDEDEKENDENQVGDLNRDRSDGTRAGRVSRAMPKTLQVAELSQRKSLSYSAHDGAEHSRSRSGLHTSVWHVGLEDHSHRNVLLPLQLNGSRPITPRSCSKLPLSPRSPLSPRGSFSNITNNNSRNSSPNKFLHLQKHVLAPPVLSPNRMSPQPLSAESKQRSPATANSVTSPHLPLRPSARTLHRHHRSKTFSSLSCLPHVPEVAWKEVPTMENDTLPPPSLLSPTRVTKEQDEEQMKLSIQPLSQLPSSPSSEQSTPIQDLRAIQPLQSESLPATTNPDSASSPLPQQVERNVEQLLSSSPPRPIPAASISAALPFYAHSAELSVPQFSSSIHRKELVAADEHDAVSTPAGETEHQSKSPFVEPSPSTSILFALQSKLQAVCEEKQHLESQMNQAQQRMLTYVNQMRHRYMQRAFTVIKFHYHAKQAGSDQSLAASFARSMRSSSARRYFALSLDGQSLWWSKHPSMENASSMSLLEVNDLSIALVGVDHPIGATGVMDVQSSTKVTHTGEFRISTMMEAMLPSTLYFDPITDQFVFPQTLTTTELFGIRRQLYRAVLESLSELKRSESTTPELSANSGYEQLEDEKPQEIQKDQLEEEKDNRHNDSNYNSPLPSKSANSSSPSTSFFPSPLKVYHAAHWRLSFHSASRSLDLLFQTKSDIDVWVEFMQRIWQQKWLIKMEEKAKRWKPAMTAKAAQWKQDHKKEEPENL